MLKTEVLRRRTIKPAMPLRQTLTMKSDPNPVVGANKPRSNGDSEKAKSPIPRHQPIPIARWGRAKSSER